MRWKWDLAFNNDDENYVQIFTKKMMKTMYKYLQKKHFTFPPPSASHLSVPMSLSEIEIK